MLRFGVCLVGKGGEDGDWEMGLGYDFECLMLGIELYY